MKSFYRNESENVFTTNNWTLSDEVIEIFKDNFFYKEHVRWNIKRYRPTDVPQEGDRDHNARTPLTQISQLSHAQKIVADGAQIAVTRKPSNYAEENSITCETDIHSMSTQLKRKEYFDPDSIGHQTRTQTGVRKQIKYTNRR